MMTDDELLVALDEMRSHGVVRSKDIIALVRANTKPQTLSCTEEAFVKSFAHVPGIRVAVDCLKTHGAVFDKPKMLLRNVRTIQMGRVLEYTHRMKSNGRRFARVGEAILMDDGSTELVLNRADEEVEPLDHSDD